MSPATAAFARSDSQQVLLFCIGAISGNQLLLRCEVPVMLCFSASSRQQTQRSYFQRKQIQRKQPITPASDVDAFCRAFAFASE